MRTGELLPLYAEGDVAAYARVSTLTEAQEESYETQVSYYTNLIGGTKGWTMVKVYADKLPFEGNSFQAGKEMDIDPVSAAFGGGDDNVVLLVIPALSYEKFHREFPTFSVIGHMAKPEAGAVLVTPEGVEFPVKAQGWKEE